MEEIEYEIKTSNDYQLESLIEQFTNFKQECRTKVKMYYNLV